MKTKRVTALFVLSFCLQLCLTGPAWSASQDFPITIDWLSGPVATESADVFLGDTINGYIVETGRHDWVMTSEMTFTTGGGELFFPSFEPSAGQGIHLLGTETGNITPEPGTMLLWGVGLAVLLTIGRVRRSRW